MKGINELMEILKELTAATSPQISKEFAVTYSFFSLCFRDYFKKKSQVSGNLDLGNPMKRKLSLFPQLRGAALGNIPAVYSVPINPLHAQQEQKTCF